MSNPSPVPAEIQFCDDSLRKEIESLFTRADATKSKAQIWLDRADAASELVSEAKAAFERLLSPQAAQSYSDRLSECRLAEEMASIVRSRTPQAYFDEVIHSPDAYALFAKAFSLRAAAIESRLPELRKGYAKHVSGLLESGKAESDDNVISPKWRNLIAVCEGALRTAVLYGRVYRDAPQNIGGHYPDPVNHRAMIFQPVRG